MRFRSFVAATLLCLFGAAGCESAHIKDVYLSLDNTGRRRSNCIRPFKLDGTSGNHYWVFVEMLSFRDDTLLTPILREYGPAGPGNLIQLEPAQQQGQNELTEYGNIAPGEGDHILSWEMLGAKDSPTTFGPLQVGNFVWEFYLDDHSSPDEQIVFAVNEKCN